jgi:hypothetical protein
VPVALPAGFFFPVRLGPESDLETVLPVSSGAVVKRGRPSTTRAAGCSGREPDAIGTDDRVRAAAFLLFFSCGAVFFLRFGASGDAVCILRPVARVSEVLVFPAPAVFPFFFLVELCRAISNPLLPRRNRCYLLRTIVAFGILIPVQGSVNADLPRQTLR